MYVSNVEGLLVSFFLIGGWLRSRMYLSCHIENLTKMLVLYVGLQESYTTPYEIDASTSVAEIRFQGCMYFLLLRERK